MPHFKLTIAYDGTPFVGWQRQAAGASIQGLLEEAMSPLEGAPVAVAGAGRTDAGVHAEGQVASVTFTRAVDGATVVRATNWRLPPEVRILDAVEVSPDFHARFSARSKTYRYRIWNGEVVSPFERAYVWHVPTPELDAAAMNRAAAWLEGPHDFAAFQTAGADVSSTTRTVFMSRVSRDPSRPVITYEIRGDGFLRHMVRGIVGTLVDVGRGRRPASWVGDVLASRSRAEAGVTAPAQGLCLMHVGYGEGDF